MLDIVFYTVMTVIFLAVFFAHGLLPLLDIIKPDLADEVRRNEYLLDAHRRGLDGAQVYDEMTVRSIWAEVRYEASKATLRNPAGYLDHVDAALKSATEILKAMGRPDLIKPLYSMKVATSDALTPEANKAVDRFWASRPIEAADERLMAFRASALRVQR